MSNYPGHYDADGPNMNSGEQPTPLDDVSSEGTAPGHQASMAHKARSVSRLWPAQWDGALRNGNAERFRKLRQAGNSKDHHGRNSAAIHGWETDVIGRMKSAAGEDDVQSAGRAQGRTRELMAYLMGQHGDGEVGQGRVEGDGESQRGRVEKKGDWENIDMQVWG